MQIMDLAKASLLSFIPIMVALDAPGTLPIYVAMTEGIRKHERRTIVRQSIITALLITIGFVFLGRAVFHALGILVEDFMIAGGIVLLIIAVSEIVRAGERKILISPDHRRGPLRHAAHRRACHPHHHTGARRHLWLSSGHSVAHRQYPDSLGHLLPGGPDHQTHRHQRIPRLCQDRGTAPRSHRGQNDQDRHIHAYRNIVIRDGVKTETIGQGASGGEQLGLLTSVH